MQRKGRLIEQIVSRDNLRLAFALANKGRRSRNNKSAPNSIMELEHWLRQLGEEISRGTVEVGKFHHFIIHDPKRRIIHAAPFRERVLHHAIMNVAGPILDRILVDDTYACRYKKGVHRARQRAQVFSRSFKYYLKLDVQHYFDSISHQVLHCQFERLFKDEKLLNLLKRIIAAYETEPGRGLPIGSLISQHAANAYLGPLDRFIKEHLPVQGYANGFVRYMDDFVLWSHSQAVLSEWKNAVVAFADTRLRLTIKPTIRLGRSNDGLPFLGARITPWAIYPRRSSRRRLVRKVREYEAAYANKMLSEKDLQLRVLALFAAMEQMSCKAWRQRFVASA